MPLPVQGPLPSGRRPYRPARPPAHRLPRCRPICPLPFQRPDPGKAPAALGTQLRVKVIPSCRGGRGRALLRCLSGRRLSVLFEALPEGGVCFGQRQLPPRSEAEDRAGSWPACQPVGGGHPASSSTTASQPQKFRNPASSSGLAWPGQPCRAAADIQRQRRPGEEAARLAFAEECRAPAASWRPRQSFSRQALQKRAAAGGAF